LAIDILGLAKICCSPLRMPPTENGRKKIKRGTKEKLVGRKDQPSEESDATNRKKNRLRVGARNDD